jgi:dihydroorotate dehydrogenase
MTEFREPPKGYNNIDLANIQFKKLVESVNNCDSQVPALTFSSTRWLENALYSREIIEEEYDKRMKNIKEQTRIFDENCSCLNATKLRDLEKQGPFG